MRLVVDTGASSWEPVPWLVGFACICVSDLLWFSVAVPLGVYAPRISSGGRAWCCGGKTTGVGDSAWFGILAYGAMTSAVGAVFASESAGDAFCGGALLGFVVFASFWITTFAVEVAPRPPPADLLLEAPGLPELPRSWRWPNAVVDVAYGVVATGVLHAVQHEVRKEFHAHP